MKLSLSTEMKGVNWSTWNERLRIFSVHCYAKATFVSCRYFVYYSNFIQLFNHRCNSQNTIHPLPCCSSQVAFVLNKGEPNGELRPSWAAMCEYGSTKDGLFVDWSGYWSACSDLLRLLLSISSPRWSPPLQTHQPPQAWQCSTSLRTGLLLGFQLVV